jgi:tRNA G18 (ribose-2'-O)-methylase SpoU
MGAIFHVPIFGADLKEVIPLLQQANISIIGTSLRAKTTYYQASY